MQKLDEGHLVGGGDQLVDIIMSAVDAYSHVTVSLSGSKRGNAVKCSHAAQGRRLHSRDGFPGHVRSRH